MTPHHVYLRNGCFYYHHDSAVRDEICEIHELLHGQGIPDAEIAEAVQEYLAGLACEYLAKLN